MEQPLYLLVGTYTSENSKGIHLFTFDEINGKGDFLNETEVENPSYLAAGKNGEFIYAVSENEQKPSFIHAFKFDRKLRKLEHLNTRPTQGSAPCYVAVDHDHRHVITANYHGGSISVFDILEDGSLSEIKQLIRFSGKGKDPERQDRPHIHCVKFSPDHRYLFATDLGTDHIYRFAINAQDGDYLNEHTMETYTVLEGSGPRHIIFHPSGKYGYLINELSGMVIGYHYSEGELIPFQSIAVNEEDEGDRGDIGITPDGKFLYASSRIQNDGVASFTIDPDNGKLTKTGYINTGIHPRNIGVTPNGKFLLVANRDSDSIEIYEIDQNSGLLHDTGKNLPVNKPVCIIYI